MATPSALAIGRRPRGLVAITANCHKGDGNFRPKCQKSVFMQFCQIACSVYFRCSKDPRGQIVFINSSAALSIAPGRGYYTATQYALRALADALRQEVNADDVRVLNVYPGRMATPRTERLFAKEARPYQPDVLMQPEDIAAIVLSALALDCRGHGYRHKADEKDVPMSYADCFAREQQTPGSISI